VTDGPDAALLDRFAPFYDLEYGDYDVDLDLYVFYAAETAGPEGRARVLELACGSGRVLRALAAAGHTCTGVDASPAMLARARSAAAAAGRTITWLQAPLQQLPAALGAFDLVFCALDSFAFLTTQADQLAMLTGAWAALRPGGILLLDLSPVPAEGPFPANGELVLQASWPRPDGGRVLKLVSATWDAAEQLQHVHWIYDEEDPAGGLRRTTIPQTLRYTHRWEAGLLVERAGFVLQGVYGSYDLQPYTAESPRLIVVAARPRGGA